MRKAGNANLDSDEESEEEEGEDSEEYTDEASMLSEEEDDDAEEEILKAARRRAELEANLNVSGEEGSGEGADERTRVLSVLELEDLFVRSAPDLSRMSFPHFRLSSAY